MRKKELLKMRSLKPTKHIMEMAAEDKPVKKTWYYCTQYTEHKRAIYLRCLVQNGILKVAIFLTEHLRTGGQLPAFEVYLSNKERKFITFDRLKGKWLNSKLDKLDWPRYIGPDEEKWISRTGYNTIQNYLGTSKGGFYGLLEFQLDVRAEALKARHARTTNRWDKDLAQVPPLPKDWERWVSRVGIPEHFMFYEYSKKGAKTGYCSHCGKEVPITRARYDKVGRCPRCRKKVTYKSYGKAGNIFTDKFNVYLIQRCVDGCVIRRYHAYRVHQKGEHKNPKTCISELRLTICDKDGNRLRSYYMGLFKQRTYRWILDVPCEPGWWYSPPKGRVYRKTLPSLAKQELRLTGIPEIIAGDALIDPEYYLAVLARIPLLEQLAKAKLPRLAMECIYNYNSVSDYVKGTNNCSLTAALGINSQELKRLRACNGNFLFLDWLRYEKASGVLISDHVIYWFCQENISPDKLSFIRDKMSPLQIKNYLSRQALEMREDTGTVLTTWKDYLSMAKALNINTDDEIVFRARKLRQRHDELVARCHQKGLAVRAGEILEKFPRLDEVCQSVKDKYEYADKEYTIIAPSGVLDILYEGDNLQHCVGKSERYWERIESRETYILFLRRTSDVEASYYTLEIEPNGTIRQKRTEYDRQNDDINDATKFLAKWQKVVAKRITEEDKALAEKSRELRNLEFEQMDQGVPAPHH